MLGQRAALPLSDTSRLEDIPTARFERLGHQLVTQYRGLTLPLFDLSELLGFASAAWESEERVSVVVVSLSGHDGAPAVSVGLLVGEIVDIVDEPNRVDADARRHGVRGAAVFQGKVAEILNVRELLHAHCPHLFHQAAE